MTQKPVAYEGNEPYIFISYAHADNDKVLPLIAGLQARGFRVWYDEGINPFDQWDETVAQKLAESHCIIAFLSQKFLASFNCREEIKYSIRLFARPGSGHVGPLPVYLETVELRGYLDMSLDSFQARYYYKYPNSDAFLDSLKSSTALQACRQATVVEWDTITFADSGDNTPVETPEDWFSQAEKQFDKGNYEEALVFYRKAADGGYAKAQKKLWKLSTLGGYKYLPISTEEALRWCRKAAEQGDMEAQRTLALVYEEGDLVAADKAAAFSWYLKAAEQGDGMSQYEVAEAYYYGRSIPRDYTRAYKWAKKAAMQGIGDAYGLLGECYAYGRGVEQNYKEARKNYQCGADKDDSVAQCGLGKCYYYGWGVEKNHDEAKYWFRQAGTPTAAYYLGLLFFYGPIAKIDYGEAMKCFERAAKYNIPGAEYMLGYCYEMLYEVNRVKVRDFRKALEYYQRAQKHGHPKAAEAVARVKKIVDRL